MGKARFVLLIGALGYGSLIYIMTSTMDYFIAGRPFFGGWIFRAAWCFPLAACIASFYWNYIEDRYRRSAWQDQNGSPAA